MRKIRSPFLIAKFSLNQPLFRHTGLVSKVVPNGELTQAAMAAAEVICNSSPLANWATKQLGLRGRDMDQASAIALMKDIATPVFNSEDIIEGRRAFTEKRKPIWKVR